MGKMTIITDSDKATTTAQPILDEQCQQDIRKYMTVGIISGILSILAGFISFPLLLIFAGMGDGGSDVPFALLFIPFILCVVFGGIIIHAHGKAAKAARTGKDALRWLQLTSIMDWLLLIPLGIITIGMPLAAVLTIPVAVPLIISIRTGERLATHQKTLEQEKTKVPPPKNASRGSKK